MVKELNEDPETNSAGEKMEIKVWILSQKCLPYSVPNVWCLFQRESPDPEIIIRTSSEHCRSASMALWLTAVYGYKGPLLVGHGTTRKPSYIQTSIIALHPQSFIMAG